MLDDTGFFHQRRARSSSMVMSSRRARAGLSAAAERRRRATKPLWLAAPFRLSRKPPMKRATAGAAAALEGSRGMPAPMGDAPTPHPCGWRCHRGRVGGCRVVLRDRPSSARAAEGVLRRGDDRAPRPLRRPRRLAHVGGRTGVRAAGWRDPRRRFQSRWCSSRNAPSRAPGSPRWHAR